MMDIAVAIASGVFGPLTGGLTKALTKAQIEATYAQMRADGTQVYPGKLMPPTITIEEWRDRELAKETA